MRGLLERYQEETGHFFNLEATPAEGTSYPAGPSGQPPTRTCALPEPAAKAQPYYAVPICRLNVTTIFSMCWYLQDSLQSSYTGGTVLHGFLGEAVTDTRTVRNPVPAQQPVPSTLFYPYPHLQRVFHPRLH